MIASYALQELVTEMSGCDRVTELDFPQSKDLSNQHVNLEQWLKASRCD